VTGRPDMSVVVCSYNRADRLGATLDALGRQTMRDRLEVLIVDDGSIPAIDEAEVARGGARLVRHSANQGPAAARNTGAAASRAPVVAFTDDDCRPAPEWAGSLLSAYRDPNVVAAGGPVVGSSRARCLERYSLCKQPFGPLEATLGRSSSLLYRFWLYARENVAPQERTGVRDAYLLAGANLSFRREVFDALGGFDAGIRVGEDGDICYRVHQAFPRSSIRLMPDAVVEHDYDVRLVDVLRRAKGYGEGNARNHAKHDRWGPTIYPAPILWIAALLLGPTRRRWSLPTLALPLLFSPRWFVRAFRSRSAEPLTYAYVQILQEGASNLGFASGWLRARHMASGGGQP
jgi:glycosyltransferase involved in cell wall biosynthesis